MCRRVLDPATLYLSTAATHRCSQQKERFSYKCTGAMLEQLELNQKNPHACFRFKTYTLKPWNPMK